MTRTLQTLYHLMALLTLVMTVTFKAWPETAIPFSADYVMGFVFVTPLILTLILWMLAGCPGIERIMGNPVSTAWVTCIALLLLWMLVSQNWAYMRGSRDAIAQNATLTYGLIAAFTVAIFCAPPPRRWLMATLVAMLLVNIVIGAGQYVAQSELGLQVLGEVSNLDPSQSGMSVIQSGDTRILRAHGLMPHPNIYAGLLIVGLCALLPLMLASKRRLRWLGWVLFAIGLTVLWFTFSRGAWVAFAAVAGLSGLWLLRTPLRTRLIMPLLIVVAVSGIFVFQSRPFIQARVTLGNEVTEQRSIADRVIYNQIAVEVISLAPVQGIGVGNFSWYAAYYFARNPQYALQGTNVHQVALLVLAELGVVGFLLFGGVITLPVLAGLSRLRHQPTHTWLIALLAAAVALGLTGVVDHYIMSIPQLALMWWTLLALIISEVAPEAAPPRHNPPP